MDDRAHHEAEAPKNQPTWKKIKAAEAEALVSWPAYWISTYASYAEELDQLGDAIEKADPDLT